jgi:hypothetical protein
MDNKRPAPNLTEASLMEDMKELLKIRAKSDTGTLKPFTGDLIEGRLMDMSWVKCVFLKNRFEKGPFPYRYSVVTEAIEEYRKKHYPEEFNMDNQPAKEHKKLSESVPKPIINYPTVWDPEKDMQSLIEAIEEYRKKHYPEEFNMDNQPAKEHKKLSERMKEAHENLTEKILNPLLKERAALIEEKATNERRKKVIEIAVSQIDTEIKFQVGEAGLDRFEAMGFVGKEISSMSFKITNVKEAIGYILENELEDVFKADVLKSKEMSNLVAAGRHSIPGVRVDTFTRFKIDKSRKKGVSTDDK